MKELFIVAYYTKKPKATVNTCIAGWMNDERNYQYDERVEFTRNLKKRDVSMAGIILNLRSKSVFKNTFNPEQRNFTLLFKYFLDGYTSQAVQAMSELDPEYLMQFLPKPEEPTVVDAEVIDVEVESVPEAV